MFDNDISDSAVTEQSDKVKDDRKKFAGETDQNDYKKRLQM